MRGLNQEERAEDGTRRGVPTVAMVITTGKAPKLQQEGGGGANLILDVWTFRRL